MNDFKDMLCTRRQILAAGLAGGVAGTLGAFQAADGNDHPAKPPKDAIVGTLVDDVNLRGIEDVHLDGKFAYLPCREGQRLTVCDIEAPNSPQVVSSLAIPEFGEIPGFAHDGDTLYLTSSNGPMLWVIDASDKSRLKPVGSVDLGAPGMVYKVAFQDGFCYVAHNGAKQLFVVDVRKPSAPRVISHVVVTEGKDRPFSVLLHDHYALVGTVFGKQNCFAVIDIRDPHKPQWIRSLTEPGLCQMSGTVLGDILYAACWSRNRFYVVSLKDPANPRILGSLEDARLGNPNRCAAIGDRAYLPMVSGHGVAVVDTSRHDNPRFVAAYQDPVLMKKTYGAAARDDLVFIGSRSANSLVVFDREKLG